MRDSRAAEVAEQATQLALAVQWAAMHPAESIIDAACFGDSPVPVAGPGARRFHASNAPRGGSSLTDEGYVQSEIRVATGVVHHRD